MRVAFQLDADAVDGCGDVATDADAQQHGVVVVAAHRLVALAYADVAVAERGDAVENLVLHLLADGLALDEVERHAAIIRSIVGDERSDEGVAHRHVDLAVGGVECIVGVAELLERDAHLVLREHPRHLRRVGVGGSGLVVAQLVRRLDVGAASDVIEVVVAVLSLHEHPLVVLGAGVGVVLARRPDEVARVGGAVVEHATAVGIDDLIGRELLYLLRCRLLAQGDGVELVALSRALGGVD